jgi:hypothetical protein
MRSLREHAGDLHRTGNDVTDYAMLVRLREQALRTRVMQLEDVIRRYLHGMDDRAGLQAALDALQEEEQR